MGYAMLTAPCGQCEKLFTSNPKRVPSLNNVPFCLDCMTEGNKARVEAGKEPHPIHPDAYEPCDEKEL